VEGVALTVEGEVRADTIRARDVNGTTSVSKLAVTGSLTVGGASVVGGSPFYCAGKVGFNGAVLATSGQVSFTVVRTGSGLYSITFASPHPVDNNIVQVSSFGYAAVTATSATGFSLQIRNTALTVADHTFFFSVLA
jgi:hypothetical protein